MERLTVKWKDGIYDTFDPIDVSDNEYSKINYQKLINKLGQYEDAEEKGLLLRLPCKVGDTVWHIHKIPRLKTERTVIAEVEADAFFITLCVLEGRFGKTAFLTKEEAEQALKRMESE